MSLLENRPLDLKLSDVAQFLVLCSWFRQGEVEEKISRSETEGL